GWDFNRSTRWIDHFSLGLDWRMNHKRLCWLSLTLLSIAGCASDGPGRWIKSNAAKDLTPKDVPQITVANPTAEAPVTAGMSCARNPGKDNEFDLFIRLRIAEGYYLHAPDEKHPDMIPVSASLDFGNLAEATSELVFPTGSIDESGYAVYRDEIVLRARFRPSDSAAEIPIKATINYQVCSATSCLPPSVIVLSQQVAAR
ncbi:MAG: protein-disulfide reductase DsbD N-terminal domain-containing protein, partial [bacterium]|nr:protein-disulfide reductase DsbD N-terminal domain-containing protein [bacterium]